MYEATRRWQTARCRSLMVAAAIVAGLDVAAIWNAATGHRTRSFPLPVFYQCSIASWGTVRGRRRRSEGPAGASLS